MTTVPVLDFDVEVNLRNFALAARFTAWNGITALFGPSGSGKTTIINLIAGLSRPDRGKILLSGLPLVDTDHRIFVPKHMRRMGLVTGSSSLQGKGSAHVGNSGFEKIGLKMRKPRGFYPTRPFAALQNCLRPDSARIYLGR